MMKIDMSKKYRTKDGYNVRVICVDRDSIFPVIALIEYSMGEEVAYYTAEGNRLCDRTSDCDLVEVSPYEDFKIDDKVLVSNDGEHWLTRHFAGIDFRGNPTAFTYGTSSFTVDTMIEEDKTITYKYCKKYEPTNI